ncbi:hypothetical protein [Nocardioides sp. URHA0020]|uniref:hypothetical protein n=1 Tax=Nocardioides sp. URHA0020 TaxID=1380392 RepID=UPI0012DDC008|nr:hypothetical protein [Nocardioides sp. URHA0020]
MPEVSPEVSDYRFAPAVSGRIVGGLLVVLAVLLSVVTLVVAVSGLSILVLVGVAVLGVLGVLAAGHLLTRRIVVVHLGTTGYRVRLVRGAGVTAAAWTEVGEAVTATPRGLPVLVLKLVDGRTTTIPVTLLDVDREQFVRDLQGHLRRGQGLRPLS